MIIKKKNKIIYNYFFQIFALISLNNIRNYFLLAAQSINSIYEVIRYSLKYHLGNFATEILNFEHIHTAN